MADYTTINKPSLYFNTKLYTGNNTSQNITGVGFQPDWVWIKSRSNTERHVLTDVVRGVNKEIRSNTNEAETDRSSQGGVTAFTADGFNVGADDAYNDNGNNMVSWNWKAGGGQGSSNTDGSINTTYTSVNTTAGFSISQYTGTGSNATVGHGLGVRPDLVFIKRLNSTSNWAVISVGSSNSAPYQTIGSNDGNLGLNLTRSVSGSEATGDNRLSTNSSNTIYNIGNDASVNASGGTYVAYCFSEKRGYSRFGRYTGNGSAVEAPMVNCGFKPAWVLIKNASATEHWWIFDNKRNAHTGNYRYYALRPSTNSSEATSSGDNNHVDFLSNGFKLRTSVQQLNGSGHNMVYMAFAEQPIVNGLGNPVTAN